jgi:glycosyltransferase involved in cell wall biosynthesis
MKVLQVAKFYPPDHGGIEAVARDLSAGFVRHGLEVSVLCAAKRWRHSDEVDASGVRVTRAASMGLWLSTSMAPGLVWQLWRRRREADVVHVHMPDPLAALAVWLARPAGRLVLHWHSDVVRQRIARHLYRPLERWLLGRADAVVATSRAYADSSPALRDWRHKVVVIPIGAPPPARADPARVARLRARHGGRRIVFALGRMTYYKGWEVLVEAARALPDDVAVVIGGGGPGLPRYRALAERAGLPPGRLVFTGPLSAAGVEAHFAAADVFCMASTVRAEAYGVAVLEAMARGVAVVATDIPGSGLGWLHRHGVTGLSVPVRDAPALAAALRRLLDDEALRRRCGAAGRARWAAHFTAETMADETVALYRRLLAPAPGAAHPDNQPTA